jgi:hypothetical protein
MNRIENAFGILYVKNSSFAPFNSTEDLSHVTWTGLIQVNFEDSGPSPYIFFKAI